MTVNNIELKHPFIEPASAALTVFLDAAITRRLEPIRVGRAQMALFYEDRATADVSSRVESYLLATQQLDKGWADPEETAWAVGVLMHRGHRQELVRPAMNWLISAHFGQAGWSRHSRDRTRIPTTAIVLSLVPQIACESDHLWLRREWDFDLGNPVRLSYKGGFYLLGESNSRECQYELVEKTISHLERNQNDDGGFGPWKEHPIGSDPWSTGVVLWGLSKWIDRVNPEVIERALSWLERTQLPSGYWPCHYLDEGTSYALIGAVSAMKALETRASHV